MNDLFRRTQEAIFIAIRAGLVSGLVYFIVDASTAFLVTGEGHENAFSGFMSHLRKIPLWIFGKNSYGTAVSGALFWGALIGLVTFFYFFFRKKAKSN